jgi:L-amino acid N-acyltransferase YncA
VQPEGVQKAQVAVISLMEEKHWPTVREIYQAGIDTGHATFEASPPATWEAWQENHIHELSLVALEGGVVLGWASLSPSSDRCVYAGVAENSVYVAPSAKGRGVGRQLLGELIERSEVKNIWTLQAGIFPENVASVALHKSAKFHPIGIRQRLGKMRQGPLAGQWRDVLILERRSTRVGIS